MSTISGFYYQHFTYCFRDFWFSFLLCFICPYFFFSIAQEYLKYKYAKENKRKGKNILKGDKC